MNRRYHSTIERKPGIIIHTTIRSSSSLRTISNGPVDRDKNLPSTSFSSHIHHHRNVSSIPSVAPIVEKTLKGKTSSIITVKSNQSNRCLSQNNTSNSKTTLKNNHNNPKGSDIQLDRTNPVNKQHRESKPKYIRRRFAYYCCSCSRLCAALSVFAALLFGIAVAAIVVGLLTKGKATTTTTIEITTTTVTTTSTSTTTTTTTTSTTTTITTSTTATTTLPVLSITSNDTLQGIWQTTAGGGSTLATPGLGVGNYVAAEGPTNAFDNNCGTKFTSFGTCALNIALSSLTCGLNTGFYVILQRGAAVMQGLQFCTGNDFPPRDPMTMSLEGSNQTGAALMPGSSWSLIYSGSCGLGIDPGRQALGQIQSFSYNSIAYSSYRILITSKRDVDFAVQYSELKLFGY